MKVVVFLCLFSASFAVPVAEAPAEEAPVEAPVEAPAEPVAPSGTFLYRGLPFAPAVYSGANWLGGQHVAPLTYGAPLAHYGASLTPFASPLAYGAPLGASLTADGKPVASYTRHLHHPFVASPLQYTAGVKVADDKAHITYNH